MERIILHIDVNSAFLSWSAIKLLNSGFKKDIRNEVSVIAGDPKKRHGVIVAASIPAKKKGIKPPINLYEARKIYPNIIVVKPDRDFYKLCSTKLMTFLKKLFSRVEQFSIDECFIDYTDMKRIYGDEIEFAYKLKDEIYKRFGFTVNIGIGNNKLCAKMASDFEKPNKVHTLYLSEFKDKMYDKDISDLFMAGKSSCSKLRSIGINTIGELANYDENKLILLLKSQGKLLHQYANGIDDSELDVNSYDERKSIGFSKTLEFSTDNNLKIYELLREFSEEISSILKKKGLYASTVTVTIRNNDFKTVNHQKKLVNSINNEVDLFSIAKELFNKLWDRDKVRLVGLSVSDLSDSISYQLSLFEETNTVKKEKETDDLISNINKKIGKNVIFKANKIK